MLKVYEYLSRKFLLSVASLLGSFALAWTGKDMGGWIGSVTAILAFYNGSNVYQEYLASRKKDESAKEKEA